MNKPGGVSRISLTPPGFNHTPAAPAPLRLCGNLG